MFVMFKTSPEHEDQTDRHRHASRHAARSPASVTRSIVHHQSHRACHRLAAICHCSSPEPPPSGICSDKPSSLLRPMTWQFGLVNSMSQPGDLVN
ncbi:hypothetical protein F2Q69_00048457 [Brassica cretica]|uniref:Uncharacterized protein n=1 Tax=Brassica cretica TaxID=69181 RepID=A0A8S9Q1R5_BRACR|nr:hypothetical protein F2Q69_00048457 [Brassica cretica]